MLKEVRVQHVKGEARNCEEAHSARHRSIKLGLRISAPADVANDFPLCSRVISVRVDIHLFAGFDLVDPGVNDNCFLFYVLLLDELGLSTGRYDDVCVLGQALEVLRKQVAGGHSRVVGIA